MIKSKLKVLLAFNDSNQSKLAKEINVRQPTISAIANNTIKQFPVDVLDKICAYFNCQPNDLIEYVPSESSESFVESQNIQTITNEPKKILSEPPKKFTPEARKSIDLKRLLTDFKYQLDVAMVYGQNVYEELAAEARLSCEANK